MSASISSEYEQTFGQRGPGKPPHTVELLSGRGTPSQRGAARRRATAVVINENRARYDALFRLELLTLIERERESERKNEPGE